MNGSFPPYSLRLKVVLSLCRVNFLKLNTELEIKSEINKRIIFCFNFFVAENVPETKLFTSKIFFMQNEEISNFAP